MCTVKGSAVVIESGFIAESADGQGPSFWSDKLDCGQEQEVHRVCFEWGESLQIPPCFSLHIYSPEECPVYAVCSCTM